MPAAFPGLFWIVGIPALLIVAAPVLIHLINMLRYRRVEWAAMEFLLLSQKKHRTWIILKQLLLLLMRMVAVAAVVFLVAQPILYDRWGGLFGTTTTHHIILLDDSYSMSDRWENANAFDRAKEAVKELAKRAVEQNDSQTFTILRFSQAGAKAEARPDLSNEAVPAPSNLEGRKEFLAKIDALLEGTDASQLSVGPAGALKEVAEEVGKEGDARRVLYVFSDFRGRDWDADSEVHGLLDKIAKSKADVRLVYCVGEARPNLAITGLAYAGGIPAVNVAFRMRFTVHNFGKVEAKNVKVLRKTVTCIDREGQTLRNEREGSPVTIDEIQPGKSVAREIEVTFEQAGEHEVAVSLAGPAGDAIAVDNHRYCAVSVPTEAAVLLVDCGSEAREARSVEFGLLAGLRRRGERRDEGIPTGARPLIKRPKFLAEASPDDLSKFQSIFLLNVDRLDDSAVLALEKYAKAGGGVAIFVGEKTLGEPVNVTLHRTGAGLLPVPLKQPEELKADRLERAPDIKVDERQPHPLFNISGKVHPRLLEVAVAKYFRLADDWKPAPDSGTEVIAWLRNGAPLVIESRFGEGKVLTFLTTASPTWNDWWRNPTFVPTILQLHQYLAERPWPERLTGGPLPLPEVNRALYERAELYAPGDQLAPRDRIDMQSDEAMKSTGKSAAQAKKDKARNAFDDVGKAGVYDVRLFRRDKSVEVRRSAFNVDPREGDLQLADREELGDKLKRPDRPPPQWMPVGDIEFTAGEDEAHRLREKLLYFLVLLLLVETVLAWSCSYHPSARRLAPVKGGVQ